MASLPYMHSKMKLPHGWIVRVSKSYPDRVYFFNVQTGDTTWEHPFPIVDPEETPNDLHEERTAEACKKHGFPVDEMSRKRDVPGVKNRHRENSDSSDKQTNEKICRPEAIGSSLPLAVVGPAKNNPSNSELNSTVKVKSRKITVLSEKKNLSPNNRFLLDDPKDINTAEPSKLLTLNTPLHVSNKENLPSLINITGISETDKTMRVPDNYYLVVDTNIIIGSMTILRKLFNTTFHGKLPHIFIPLIVIEELENLKHTSIKNYRLFERAKESLLSIKQFIDMRHPRFHGQTVEEAAEWSQPYTMNNDDKIIECCDYLQTKLPESKIIMLTNDINLGNKGLVSDIETLDLKSLIKEYDLKIHVPEHKRKKVNKLKIVKQPIATEKMEKQVYEKVEMSSNDEAVQINESDPKAEENPQIIHRASQLLLTTLRKLLNSEIKSDFDDSSHVSEQISLNELIELLKSITTTILTRYDKYFASRYGVKLKKNVLNLKKAWENFQETDLNKDYCLNLLTNIEDIVCSVKRRLRSCDISPEDIQDMRVRILRNFESAVISKSSAKFTCEDKKTNIVYNVFEYNWNVIHHLCGMIMDFCGIDHKFSYEKPDIIPSESEFYALLQELCLSVSVLKTVMSTVVHSKLDKNAPMDKFFKKFEKVLRDFVPSLQVETEHIDMSSFNYTVLASYCLLPENRDILRGGYVQLLTFHEKLVQAYSSMKKMKNNQIDPDFKEL